jgi:uncharacterized membrane protein YphA (DoxX/SURF4 family)
MLKTNFIFTTLNMQSMNLKHIISWLLRIVAAIILLQTLYFKFTGHPESVNLFTKLGVEPWGRIGTGVIELVAGILLLIPGTVVLGALLGLALMSGAILSHLTVLGIESAGDGGQLFTLAIIVWLACAVILWLNKSNLRHLLYRFRIKN